MRYLSTTLSGLTAFGLLIAVTAFIPRDTYYGQLEDKGTISWSRSCGGVGTLRNLSLINCNVQNCSVRMDTAYSGTANFVLGSNHSSLTVNVNASGKRNVTIYTYANRGNFTRGSNVTLPYTVRFVKNLFGNLTGGYNVQLSIRDGGSTELCREFGVHLS